MSGFNVGLAPNAGVPFVLRAAPMAVSAPDIALSYLGANFVNAATVSHHAAYPAVLLLRVAVVKLQYADVVFAAINAGVIK